jgi:hypothetical protein
MTSSIQSSPQPQADLSHSRLRRTSQFREGGFDAWQGSVIAIFGAGLLGCTIRSPNRTDRGRRAPLPRSVTSVGERENSRRCYGVAVRSRLEKHTLRKK